jgi:hypothetical protein
MLIVIHRGESRGMRVRKRSQPIPQTSSHALLIRAHCVGVSRECIMLRGLRLRARGEVVILGVFGSSDFAIFLHLLLHCVYHADQIGVGLKRIPVVEEADQSGDLFLGALVLLSGYKGGFCWSRIGV